MRENTHFLFRLSQVLWGLYLGFYGQLVFSQTDDEPPANKVSAIHIQTQSAQHFARDLAAARIAWRQGQYPEAQRLYLHILAQSPQHIDALHGLATIAWQQQDYSAARHYYQQIIHLQPQDSHARSVLLHLEAAPLAPVELEQQLKIILAQQNNTPDAYFQLGQLYAQAQRWHEAEHAFSQAHHYAPEQPDYSYNLAISLEQLGQAQAALRCYQLALQLGQYQAHQFDSAIVQQRIHDLQE